MKQIIVTVRAIIIKNNQLLMCRHNEPNRSFYNLPGGKLELNETITEGMIRELIEETGIAPQLGHIMFINQFIDEANHRVEFFFYIKNGADYAQFNPATATHAHEVANFAFADPRDPKYGVQPSWLAQRFAELVAHPEAVQAEVIASR